MHFGDDVVQLGQHFVRRPATLVQRKGQRFVKSGRANVFQRNAAVYGRLNGRLGRHYRVQTHAVAQSQILYGVAVGGVGDYFQTAGRVVHYFAAHNCQVAVQVVFIRGGGSQAHFLARQVVRRSNVGIVFVDGKRGGNVVVSVGEPQHFGARFGGRHRTDAHIPARAPVAAGYHIPVRRHKFHFHAQSFGNFFGDVHIKAVQFAIVIQKTLRRVVGIRRNQQLAGFKYLIQQVARHCFFGRGRFCSRGGGWFFSFGRFRWRRGCFGFGRLGSGFYRRGRCASAASSQE